MARWQRASRPTRGDLRRAAGALAIGTRLRSRFVAVAAVTIGAMLAIVAVVVVDGARSERAALEARGLLLARSSALMVDREMSRLDAMLSGLAVSPALRSGDLAAFHEQAAAIPRPDGCWIILYDPEMNQRVNAQRPPGTPLPVAAEKSQQAMREALHHSHF